MLHSVLFTRSLDEDIGPVGRPDGLWTYDNTSNETQKQTAKEFTQHLHVEISEIFYVYFADSFDKVNFEDFVYIANKVIYELR